ncbi:hypothetical protein PCK2_000734, partial [Pneumocystis canis]
MRKESQHSSAHEETPSLIDLEQLLEDRDSSTLNHTVIQDTGTHDPSVSDFHDVSCSESESNDSILMHKSVTIKGFYKYFLKYIGVQQFINHTKKKNQNSFNSKQVNINNPTEELLLDNHIHKGLKKNGVYMRNKQTFFCFNRHKKFSSFFQKQYFKDENSNYRIINLNNHSKNKSYNYCNNYVSTAKYNIITFLPKFLFEQFSKYANLFFLFTSCIQQIPNISPTNRWTTIGPLVVVLLVSAFKELAEDFKRRSQDKQLNQSLTYAFEKTSFVPRKWVDLHVGDIVRVKSGQIFPADLVLISSSEPEGLCYIETSNLDGETNLKIKQALPETANFISPTDLNNLSGTILSEQPNNIIPEKIDGQNEIIYQAASPDEGALVKGAAKLGYKFTTRRPRSVFVSIQGKEQEFKILNICEFNSSRKRMSVILRCPDEKIRLYCKGADTVILERLSKNSLYSDQTLQHLEDYAVSGFRTLCLAMREISEEEYGEWSAIYDKAAATINNRTNELDKASELIEKELFLLGATAIEDRLQDGVPETICALQLAGIKVWVLTGDHQETAINVGISCKLITEEMNIIIINGENKKKISDYITKKLTSIKNKTSKTEETLALIIDGRSLTYALEKEIEKKFISLAVLCKTVICCRASPLQKALVVALIKKHLKATLLAIGDGSNDISMIQAANIGIGISGVEGLQAARSADIAIGQFRYLKKLLLVHGAWSYQRLSKLILYSFYKNISLHMTQFWYAFHNGFSGQVIFESWTISFYN